MVKTLCFYYSWRGFDPGRGTKIPRVVHSGQKGKKKKIDSHLNWLGGCEDRSGVMVSLGESK